MANDAFEIDTLYLRVSQKTGLELATAREQTRVVCQAISEVIDHDTLTLLGRTLPEPLARLLEPAPQSPERHAPHKTAQPQRNILATGKPGSSHPLSESATDGRQSQSVASSNNPHGDSKMSSAGADSMVSDDDDLAHGVPGSKRPLSDSR